MRVIEPEVRVLVVDSDPVSRAVTANVLEAAGLPVVGQASDPTQVLELAAATNPNTAIVDVDMPGMGDPTLARRLREVSEHRIEIVAQAGFTDVGVLGEMVAGGTSAYVIKGKPAELIAAIRAVTSGSGLMSAEASRPVLEEIQKLYDRERARNGELEQMVTQL
jgi:DNA-binding NarL/FixJ family response regulator